MSSKNNKKIKYSTEKRYFDDYGMLTNRPEGMDKDEYKIRVKAQNKVIKEYLKGKFIHISKLLPTPAVLEKLGFAKDHYPTTAEILIHSKTKGNEMSILLLKGYTYEKN